MDRISSKEAVSHSVLLVMSAQRIIRSVVWELRTDSRKPGLRQGNCHMPADQIFSTVSAFGTLLRELRAKRRGQVKLGRNERVRRAVLTAADRSEVLRKTGGRCHICRGT